MRASVTSGEIPARFRGWRDVLAGRAAAIKARRLIR